MIYKTLTTRAESYNAPIMEVIALSENTVLCTSADGTTEDFEFDEFTL